MGKLAFKGYCLSFFCFFIGLSSNITFAQSGSHQHISFIDSVNGFSFQYVTTNPNEARLSLNKALALSDSLDYKQGMARSLEQLSWASSYLGEWDESVEQRIRSIRLYEELNLMLNAGYGYAELAWAVRRRSHERAEYFMKQGFAILKEFPRSTELANAFNNYGIIKLEQAQTDSAIYFIEKSLEIKEANRDTLGIAYSYGYLGSAFQEMEDYDQAIAYLRDSYELKKVMKDSSGMAIDLTNIAANYNFQGAVDLAAGYFRRSAQMANSINYSHLEEHNYNSLAELFQNQAQYDSALHYFKLYNQVKEERIDESTGQRLAELEVQFETEQKEKELAVQRAELASTQLQIRNRNWILSALGGLLVFGGIITTMVVRQQKIKQRENELKLKLAEAETQNRIHQERERISRDLHDNVGAQITSLISGLEISNLYVKRNKTEDALNLIETLDANARDAMGELRETIWLLNKNEIPMGDFIGHLRNYIKKHEASYGGLKIDITNSVHEEKTLNAQQSLNMLRIIQEAIANCVKYAEASLFTVNFIEENGTLLLKLCDDGLGLNKPSSNESLLNGNGLLNMKRRAEELEGKLHIDQHAKNGFSILVQFPLTA